MYTHLHSVQKSSAHIVMTVQQMLKYYVFLNKPHRKVEKGQCIGTH